jgi:hypothetical protein
VDTSQGAGVLKKPEALNGIQKHWGEVITHRFTTSRGCIFPSPIR